MTQRDHSEYDAISMRPNLSLVSLFCVFVPLCFTLLADDIAYVLRANLRIYMNEIAFGAIAFCAVGLLAGIVGLRRGDSRAVAQVGILSNGFVLLLLVLFLTIFRLIRYGDWT